jgi:FAD-dependent monooxygenase
MRQTQIIFEATLKQLVHVHSLVQDYWGYSFESLVENDENDDSVLSTICDPSGNRIVIKSRYVIGCNGAGSKVRSSAGLLSPRRLL